MLSMPTADQVAAVIVAAARETGADPVRVLKVETTAEKRARTYAAFALRKLFPECPMPAIGRMVGSDHPPYVSIVYSKIMADQFQWFDMEALQRVLAAVGGEIPVRCETAQKPPARAAAPLPARKVGPNFGTVGGMGPPRPNLARDLIGEKARMRAELEQAVRNTAKLPSQN